MVVLLAFVLFCYIEDYDTRIRSGKGNEACAKC